MGLLGSLTLLHDGELLAVLNLANVIEVHGFLRPRVARQVRREILRRLTARAQVASATEVTSLDRNALLAPVGGVVVPERRSISRSW